MKLRGLKSVTADLGMCMSHKDRVATILRLYIGALLPRTSLLNKSIVSKKMLQYLTSVASFDI